MNISQAPRSISIKELLPLYGTPPSSSGNKTYGEAKISTSHVCQGTVIFIGGKVSVFSLKKLSILTLSQKKTAFINQMKGTQHHGHH